MVKQPSSYHKLVGYKAPSNTLLTSLKQTAGEMVIEANSVPLAVTYSYYTKSIEEDMVQFLSTVL